MSNKPLRIAFLWHNHQPYYEKDGEFILPWVRLHAVKDYYDLPLLLHEFPKIKKTYNIVPSLFLQLEKYIDRSVEDTIQKLTKIPAKDLNEEQKIQILKSFFLCNENNMIRPYPRYNELFEKSKKIDAVNLLVEQDWLDLQVWYNLTWLGEFSKTTPFAKRLFNKGCKFTEKEKMLLLDFHLEIIKNIKVLFNNLIELGQVSISTTPYYHPILPLLCNSEIAKEANPMNPSCNPQFLYPEDANQQIQMSIDFYQKEFGSLVKGFWPSEGSISNESIKLFIKNKVKWIASDEAVLFASEYPKTYLEKFFPRKYASKDGEITIFFRDHTLSDKIGFVYSNWNPHDAAKDFVDLLLKIRTTIINNLEEKALDSAIVSIILDGENCWEYYPKNGSDFQRALYSLILNTPELQTCFLDEAAEDGSNEFLQKMSSIRSGSWIDGNFNIWIGHNDDIEAWNMLSKVRQKFEQQKSSFSKELCEKIYNELYIAEGSDWFWWYGPEHNAENKEDFDVLFRWHIKNLYDLMGESIPEEVFLPIPKTAQSNITLPKTRISPAIDGKEDSNIAWENSGNFSFSPSFSTMHQIGLYATKIFFGNDEHFLFFKIEDFWKTIHNKIITIDIAKGNVILQFDSTGISIKSKNEGMYDGYSFSIGKIAVVRIPFEEYSNEKIMNLNVKMIDLTNSKTTEENLDFKLL